MLYDKIFNKIQEVDQSSTPLEVEEARREAFLRSWLNQYPSKPKSLAMDSLAREIALELAEKNVPQALTLLYSKRGTIETKGTLTPEYFLHRQFLLEPTDQGLQISALRAWSKIPHGVNQSTVEPLIVLYEAALAEVKQSSLPEWIKIEAMGSLRNGFDLPLLKAQAFVQDRKNRVAALMIGAEQEKLPTLQAYWKAYEGFFGAQALRAEISTELKYAPNMGLPETESLSHPDERIFSAHLTAQELVEFKRNKIHAWALAQVREDLREDYEKYKLDQTHQPDPKKFLAERKNTRTDQGYTADPNSPANLLSADLALSSIDTNAPNPREQFWKLLYPEIKGVILGQDDSDWPNYGEALLAGNYLINYRKLALMAQHREALKCLLNQESSVNDSILLESLKAHPHYRALSQDEVRALEKFNQDQAYWRVGEFHELGANAFVFFTNLRNVLDKFRANREGNEHLELEMTEEGIEAIRPYLRVMETSALVAQLKKLKQGLPSQASEQAMYLDFLIGFQSRMKIYKESCYGTAYALLGNALESLGDSLKNLSLEAQKTQIWENQTQGHDTCPPTQVGNAIIQSCLNKISDKKVLFEWLAMESARGTPLPVKWVAERFIELSDTMTVVDIYNFVYVHFPQGEDLLFADQQGNEESAAYSKSYFMSKVFKNGIEARRLNTPKDCQFALKIHNEFGVPGKGKTIESIIVFIKFWNDRDTSFRGIRELLVDLLSAPEISQKGIADLMDIVVRYASDARLIAGFLSSFELTTLDNLAQSYFEAVCRKRGITGIVGNAVTQENHASTGDRKPDYLTLLSMYFIPVFQLLSEEFPYNLPDNKKSLILFEKFLPLISLIVMTTDQPITGIIPSNLKGEVLLNLPVMLCMAVMNRCAQEPHAFATALAVTLSNLPYRANAAVDQLLGMVESQEQPELNAFDKQRNDFIRQIKAFTSPVGLGVLLSTLKKRTILPAGQLLSAIQQFSKRQIINKIEDWLVFADYCKSVEMEICASYVPIPVFSVKELSILPSLIDKEMTKYIEIDPRFFIYDQEEWFQVLEFQKNHPKAFLNNFFFQGYILSHENSMKAFQGLYEALPYDQFVTLAENRRLGSVFDIIKTTEDFMIVLNLQDTTPSIAQIDIDKLLYLFEHCPHLTKEHFLCMVESLNEPPRSDLALALLENGNSLQLELNFNEFFRIFQCVKPPLYHSLLKSLVLQLQITLDAWDNATLPKWPPGMVFPFSLSLSSSNFLDFIRSIPNISIRAIVWSLVADGISEAFFRHQIFKELIQKSVGDTPEERFTLLTNLKQELKEKTFFHLCDDDEIFSSFVNIMSGTEKEATALLAGVRIDELLPISRKIPQSHYMNIVSAIQDPSQRHHFILNTLNDQMGKLSDFDLVKFLLNLEPPVDKESLIALHGLLARFSAIYHLLIQSLKPSQRSEVEKLRLKTYLSPTDLKGWKELFNSSEMSEGSLCFKAWTLSQIDSDKLRENEVIGAVVTLKSLSPRLAFGARCLDYASAASSMTLETSETLASILSAPNLPQAFNDYLKTLDESQIEQLMFSGLFSPVFMKVNTMDDFKMLFYSDPSNQERFLVQSYFVLESCPHLPFNDRLELVLQNQLFLKFPGFMIKFLVNAFKETNEESMPLPSLFDKLPESVGAPLLSLLSDELARTQAIFHLIRDVMPQALDSNEAYALETLSFEDLKGWTAFFNSPSMKQTDSLPFQIWSAAFLPDPPRREAQVIEIMMTHRSRAPSGGRVLHAFHSSRNEAEPLNDQTLARIKEACSVTAHTPFQDRPKFES
jgi:hypothetical protein